MAQTNPRRRRPSVVDPCPILPDEVIEDIFARLPAKTVHRCRCLSRAWAATLASSDFADLHLRLANRHGGPRILFVENCRGPKLQVWSPDNHGRTTLMELPHSQDVHGRTMDNLLPRLVTHQCRGLIILQAARKHYVLNPSTGRMAALPGSRAKGDPSMTHLGLGYDTHTRTHKVVCICCLQESVRYKVYEINSVPALWRPAKGCLPDREKPLLGWVNNHDDMSVFTQGHVYWLARRKLIASQSEEMFVFSFNLDDEAFGTVPLPLPLIMERNIQDQYNLTEFGGRLCIFHTKMVCNVTSGRHNIWLLRSHDTGAWDLHYRINRYTLPAKVANLMCPGYWIGLLAVVDNGRRIVIRRNYYTMCAYVPVIDDMENLLDGSSGLVSNNSVTSSQHAALYEESIASPGNLLAT